MTRWFSSRCRRVGHRAHAAGRQSRRQRRETLQARSRAAEGGRRRRLRSRNASSCGHAPAARPTSRTARKKHGDRIESVHQRINAFTATVHGEDLSALERDPDVEAVSIDAILTADHAMQEMRGRGRSIREPPRLGARTRRHAVRRREGRHRRDRFGTREERGPLGRPCRQILRLHGGRQAGPSLRRLRPWHPRRHLIAGKGKDSERDVEVLENGKRHRIKLALYRGLAPKARIISLKVLDANGAGYTSSVLRALEFVVANRDKLKIDIINLSLGHPIYESPDTDPLVRAVEDATRAGIVVVASAGNHGMNQETGEIGYAGITSPGNAPSAITVGALDMHDTVDRSTTPSRRTARAGRHGIQAWRSQTWWRRDTGSSPSARLGAPSTRDCRAPGVGPREGEESALPSAQRQQHGRRGHERRGRVDG